MNNLDSVTFITRAGQWAIALASSVLFLVVSMPSRGQDTNTDYMFWRVRTSCRDARSTRTATVDWFSDVFTAPATKYDGNIINEVQSAFLEFLKQDSWKACSISDSSSFLGRSLDYSKSQESTSKERERLIGVSKRDAQRVIGFPYSDGSKSIGTIYPIQ
jgi:hypothetical protein